MKDDKLINYIKAKRQDLLDDIQKCVDNELLVKYAAKHIPQIEILNKIIRYASLLPGEPNCNKAQDVRTGYCNREDFREFKMFATSLKVVNNLTEEYQLAVQVKCIE